MNGHEHTHMPDIIAWCRISTISYKRSQFTKTSHTSCTTKNNDRMVAKCENEER